MFKVVKKEDAKFRQIADNKSALNYITKDISSNVSFAITEGKDYFENEKSPYDRIYFVLNGELILTFDNEKVILKTEDACFVSKQTEYIMQGTFKAITINQPAFGI